MVSKVASAFANDDDNDVVIVDDENGVFMMMMMISYVVNGTVAGNDEVFLLNPIKMILNILYQ